MVISKKKKIEFQTDRGPIIISTFCDPEHLSTLTFKNTFTKYARYNPIISRIESLVNTAKKDNTNVTVGYTPENAIVGFCILEDPKPEDRWIRVGQGLIMEISVIEVRRQWRSTKIARELLRLVVEDPVNEHRILYMVGYSWTWDLDEKSMKVMEYRDMMVNLFSKFGFQIFQTNEPNVMMRPENLFMARIGADVSEDIKKKFKYVRFNMDL